MPLDVQAFAAEVAHTITTAMLPLLERLTAIETRLAYVGDLRDRVVTLEAKAAMPSAVPTIDDPTPLLAEMRDRVVGLEAQTAALPRIDLTPAMERVAALEARLNVLGDLRDRVVTMETKAAAPVVVPEAPEVVLPDVAPLVARLDRLETHGAAAITTAQELGASLAHVRERLAAVEVRPLLPGPAGKDGRDGIDGKDGTNGINGVAGLGFDDLVVEQDGERGVLVKFARGSDVKTFPLTFPIVMYRGVFLDGKGYSVGDVVTWAGSAWHCQQDTTDKPEENHRAWRLMVKRGNEGRAGRDGKDLLPAPVVSVGGAVLVSLFVAKGHLRIPEDDYVNDADVSIKLLQAEAIVLGYLKGRADPTWTEITAPREITTAINMMLAHLYEHRGDDPQTDAELWMAIDRLVIRFRDPALA